MAEYIVFIWDDEQSWERADPATVAATMAAHQKFIACHAARLRGRGQRRSADARQVEPDDFPPGIQRVHKRLQ